jgi:hypothetical protein
MPWNELKENHPYNGGIVKSEALRLYYEALDRLIKSKPHIVPKGTKITNDAVSLEAGRGKGSIKKSREGFAALIADIDAAALEERRPKMEGAQRLNKAKIAAVDLRDQLDAALAREMSLVYELVDIKKRLANLTGENVFPIRKR